MCANTLYQPPSFLRLSTSENGYTIGVNHKHAGRASSRECCVSGRQTFVADNKRQSAPVTSKSATSATGRSGRYSHATLQCTSAMTAKSTRLCKKKCTSMLPTDANGRISRGNDTFFTSPELATTEPVAPP